MRSVAAAIGGILLAAAPAAAQEAGDEPAAEAAAPGNGEATVPGEGAGDADLEAYWSQRLERAAKRVAMARERADEAEAAYSRARHDNNPRGEALDKIKQRHFSAERELRDAETALPRLVEQARRAGVPPGILRDYWDEDEDETS